MNPRYYPKDSVLPEMAQVQRFTLLRNSRKTAPSAEEADREFLGCLPPRHAAFALWRGLRRRDDCSFGGGRQGPPQNVEREQMGEDNDVVACVGEHLAQFPHLSHTLADGLTRHLNP